MIGNINYEIFQNLINNLTISKDNIKIIVDMYKNINDQNLIRDMNTFLSDLEKYIKYLNKTLKMNIDADNVLQDNI